jgi:uncharacterized protein YraI
MAQSPRESFRGENAMKRLSLLLFACAALCVSSAALAVNAYVTDNVNLRAGPDAGYPRIMRLEAGTAISVQGCLDGYTWCDVIALGERGWVYAPYVQSLYDDRRVALPDYGTRIGIPIISFSLGTYWGDYYRTRPWYRQRDYWNGPGWHHRPRPPMPPPHHGRPPGPKPPPVKPPPKPRPPVNPPPRPRPPVNPPPRPKPPVRPLPRPPATPKPPPKPPGINPPKRPSPPANVRPAPPKPAPRPQPKPRPPKDKDGGGN